MRKIIPAVIIALCMLGSCNEKPKHYSFVQNMNFVGNCSPVDLTLGDITPNEDFVNSTIMFLTTGGATARMQVLDRQQNARAIPNR